jgi:demethylmenaquinone methyltransferase/2-methoxy-6-polyprenyl-1,4-benzoquinol methylase
MNNQQEMLRFYQRHARIYDLTRWLFLRKRNDAAAACALNTGDTVMEIGCGTGYNFFRLQQAVGNSGQLIGVDLSSAMLARAEQRISRQGWQNVALIRANGETVQVDDRMDAVLFSYSLSMIPDWQAAVTGAVRQLKPGGRLVALDFAGYAEMPAFIRRAGIRSLEKHFVHPCRSYESFLAEIMNSSTFKRSTFGYVFMFTGIRK